MNYSNCGNDQIFIDCWTNRRETTWGVGLTTSGDLYKTTERLAYDQSLLSIEAAQRNLDQVKDTLTLEIKKTLRTLDRALKKINLQQQQIHSAEGGFYLAQIKFDRGMANNFDIIQAEKTIRIGETSLLSAVIEYIVGEYQLLASLGLLADKPGM